MGLLSYLGYWKGGVIKEEPFERTAPKLMTEEIKNVKKASEEVRTSGKQLAASFKGYDMNGLAVAVNGVSYEEQLAENLWRNEFLCSCDEPKYWRDEMCGVCGGKLNKILDRKVTSVATFKEVLSAIGARPSEDVVLFKKETSGFKEPVICRCELPVPARDTKNRDVCGLCGGSLRVYGAVKKLATSVSSNLREPMMVSSGVSSGQMIVSRSWVGSMNFEPSNVAIRMSQDEYDAFKKWKKSQECPEPAIVEPKSLRLIDLE